MYKRVSTPRYFQPNRGRSGNKKGQIFYDAAQTVPIKQ